MFWSKKPVNDAEKGRSKADLIKETQANMRVAKEAIGEENLKKMAAAIHGKPPPPKELSPREQAMKIIQNADQYKVADHILAMMRDKSH